MEERYEDSIIYIINSCAKYFNMLSQILFKELNIDITPSEHLAIKIIQETKDCSQRDLARIILKDRANTGKLAGALEKKGLIKISLQTKNNRPAKILTITKKGDALYRKIENKLLPYFEKLYEQANLDEINQAKQSIKNFRKLVENIVKVNI